MPKHTAPPKRTAALRFSSSSAKRLSHLLAGVDYGTEPLFLTLTYPVDIAPHPRVAKQQLDDFFHNHVQRLPGQHQPLAMVWRIERQKNGSPHFHCLVFGLCNDFYDKMRGYGHTLAGPERWIFLQQDLQDLWQKQIGAKSSVRIELAEIKSQVGAYLYLVGHSSKANQTWLGQDIGRYWGILGRKNFEVYQYGKRDAILTRREIRWLRDVWEAFEARRVQWLKCRYPGREVVAREWERGSLKLFPVPVMEALAAYHRRRHSGKPRPEIIAGLLGNAPEKSP